MNAKEWADWLHDKAKSHPWYTMQDEQCVVIADAIDELYEKYARAVAALRAVAYRDPDGEIVPCIDQVLAVLREAER